MKVRNLYIRVCIARGAKRSIPGSNSSSADLKESPAFPEAFLPASLPPLCKHPRTDAARLPGNAPAQSPDPLPAPAVLLHLFLPFSAGDG